MTPFIQNLNDFLLFFFVGMFRASTLAIDVTTASTRRTSRTDELMPEKYFMNILKRFINYFYR